MLNHFDYPALKRRIAGATALPPSTAAAKLLELAERPQDIRSLRLKQAKNGKGFIVDAWTPGRRYVISGERPLATAAESLTALDFACEYLKQQGGDFELICDSERP